MGLEDSKEKLLRARCRLMTREPWYGHFAMCMEWIPSDMPWKSDELSKTMGVRIVNGGQIQCLWYPGFVERLTLKELFGVIQHEIEHLVRCHCIRVGSHRHPMQWNVAADMAINGKKSSPTIGYKDTGNQPPVLPLNGNLVWLPEDWNRDQTTEALYDRLGAVSPNRCPSCGGTQKQQGGKGKKPGQGKGQQGKGQGKDQGDSNGQGDGGHTCKNCGGDCDSDGNSTENSNGQYSYGGYGGSMVDDHEVWQQTTVGADEARQVIKGLADDATTKCQGNCPGHLTGIIKELGTPVVRWREALRQYLGNHVGNSRKTYSRRNRRNDAFGMPGTSHHAAASVVVVVDTSGSIGQKELGQFFAEIEQISSRAKVSILQWDHSFQAFDKVYRKGGWKKFQLRGGGGTDMAAPIIWLGEQHLVPSCVVLLTDGYCNWAPPQPWFPECGMINIITSSPGSVGKPAFGHTVYMKLGD